MFYFQVSHISDVSELNYLLNDELFGLSLSLLFTVFRFCSMTRMVAGLTGKNECTEYAK